MGGGGCRRGTSSVLVITRQVEEGKRRRLSLSSVLEEHDIVSEGDTDTTPGVGWTMLGNPATLTSRTHNHAIHNNM